MLYERKRFNYMANAGHTATSSAQKQTYNSAVKHANTTSFCTEGYQPRVREEKEKDKANVKKM